MKKETCGFSSLKSWGGWTKFNEIFKNMDLIFFPFPIDFVG